MEEQMFKVKWFAIDLIGGVVCAAIVVALAQMVDLSLVLEIVFLLVFSFLFFVFVVPMVRRNRWIKDFMSFFYPKLATRWQLRRIDRAVDLLCEKRIRLPPLTELKPVGSGEAQRSPSLCKVCGAEAKGLTYIFQVNNPCAYKEFLVWWGKNGKISMDLLEGMHVPTPFCSEECLASYLLWMFFVPTTKEETRQLFWLKVRWKLSKLKRPFLWIFDW